MWRNINTQGGKYREVNNRDSGQYAEGNILNLFRQEHGGRDVQEKKLLKLVKEEVYIRLAQVLSNSDYINLSFQEDSSWVSNPWVGNLKTRVSYICDIEPTNSIHSILERPDVNGRLLILGDSGSGKTSTLLKMCSTLLEDAENDAECPVPILLDLKSYSGENFLSWILDAITKKYGCGKYLVADLLDTSRLFVVLDGLDEIDYLNQEVFRRNLNQFLEQFKFRCPVVIASCTSEYISHENFVGLNASVQILPVPISQVESFILSNEGEDLWFAVKDDASLVKKDGLLTRPLFLFMLILSWRKIKLDQWKKSNLVSQKAPVLFEAYIQEMLSKPYESIREGRLIAKKPFDDSQARKYLESLADFLKQRSLDVFFLEDIWPEVRKAKLNIYKRSIFRASLHETASGLKSLLRKCLLLNLLTLVIFLVFLVIQLFLDSPSSIDSIFFFLLVFPARLFLICLVPYTLEGIWRGLWAAILAKDVEEIEFPSLISFSDFRSFKFWSNTYLSLKNKDFLLKSLLDFVASFFGYLMGATIFTFIYKHILEGENNAVETIVSCCLIQVALSCTELLEVGSRKSSFTGRFSFDLKISRKNVFDARFNSTLLFLALGLLVTLAFFACFGSIIIFFISLCVLAFTAFLRLGAFDLIRAIKTTRIFFASDDVLPFKQFELLEYFVDRGFLQKVGLGYRFIHALFLEHLSQKYMLSELSENREP